MVKQICESNENIFVNASKYKVSIYMMYIKSYFPHYAWFELSMLINNLHVYPFIVTKLIAND